eukprot:Awhi_evm1s10420
MSIRLVAQGYNQTLGYHYFTSNKQTVLRLLMVISRVLGLKIYQFDVKNSYVNATIEEKVIMKPPKGIELITEIDPDEL